MFQHTADVEVRCGTLISLDKSSDPCRSKGQGELYTYLPLTPGNREKLMSVPPSSSENPGYGFSVGRNAFNFDLAVGRWISLAFRVKLNNVGMEDGAVYTFTLHYSLFPHA